MHFVLQFLNRVKNEIHPRLLINPLMSGVNKRSYTYLNKPEALTIKHQV